MNKKVKLFILITYGLSLLLAGVFYLAGGRLNTTSGFLMAVVYMYMPLLGTVIVQKLIYKKPILKPLGIKFKVNRWWIVALVLPIIISGLTFLVSILFPEVTFSPSLAGMIERYETTLPLEAVEQLKQLELNPSLLLLMIGQTVIAALTINNLAAFGEEVGWRGFLYQELDISGFWQKSTFIGVIWGLWHAPLIVQGHNYPNYPTWGAFMMIVFCILISPLFTYIRNQSGTVLGASLLHGAVNASAGLAVMFVKGGNELLVGITGLAGFVVLVGVNLGLYFLQNNSEQITDS
jgi:membrane protease YdiL (CAAX protease family)